MKPFGLEKEVDQQQEEILKKKVYIRGLPASATKETLIRVFSQFGKIEKAFILYNHSNGTSRGFGFIEFLDEESVSKCYGKTILIEGKELPVLKALERTKKVNKKSFRKGAVITLKTNQK